MSVSISVSRLAIYYSRHGCRATIRRGARSLSQALFSNRMVLFYCDLAAQNSRPTDLPRSLNVERRRNESEIDRRDLEKIVDFWNPKLACRNIEERFEHGASLWTIKSEDRLAGYGWTLQGHTIEPHYLPLGPDDVHLFDFLVLPEYRGRGLNPLLVIHILRNLAAECGGRAFIEAAEWNSPQLLSLQKTPFRRLGCARKLAIFRQTIVCWDLKKAAQQQ